MEEAILHHAAECFAISASNLRPLAGGHFAAVYDFSREDQDYVLRIIPPNDEIDEGSMRAILEWVHFLDTHGVPVAGPVPSKNGRLIEVVEEGEQRYTVVALEKATGILAEELPADRWNETLFGKIGGAVGKMHRLSKLYAPADESLRRPAWHTVGNCFNSLQPLSEVVLEEKRDRVLNTIHALPQDADSYGMVHGDLHLANFFVDVEDNSVTLFDFDDCCYGWFVMDVAMILFDILVLYPGLDKQAFAADFMQGFLRGYTGENPINTFWINQVPHFLKLLEIEIYALVCRSNEVGDLGSWVGKFMAGRQARIQGDVPYVDVDFEGILWSVA